MLSDFWLTCSATQDFKNPLKITFREPFDFLDQFYKVRITRGLFSCKKSRVFSAKNLENGESTRLECHPLRTRNVFTFEVLSLFPCFLLKKRQSHLTRYFRS